MSDSYEEILAGERFLRSAPGARHERICARLHQSVFASLGNVATTRLLPARTLVELSTGTFLRPDLALVAAATGKLWLAAEIIDAGDHRLDTVHKKEFYENARIPRLWMIDPRYDNVEVYSGGPHGLALHRILGNVEKLTEQLLPTLAMPMNQLFEE
ncbi:MAG TPA: Uma2 family endonuclease [Verrucomicrobiae bacterium]|jgi:Uma2 family endonuclease